MAKLTTEKLKVRIIKTCRNSTEDSKGSITIAIPKEICDSHDLNKPTSLYVIPKEKGILS